MRAFCFTNPFSQQVEYMVCTNVVIRSGDKQQEGGGMTLQPSAVPSQVEQQLILAGGGEGGVTPPSCRDLQTMILSVVPVNSVSAGAPLMRSRETLCHGKIIMGGKACPDADPLARTVCSPLFSSSNRPHSFLPPFRTNF